MTVPGRTSHRPLSLKPSSLLQNKERVHYLLFPNFMWKKKIKRKKTILYAINICYHSVLDPLPSSLTYRNL